MKKKNLFLAAALALSSAAAHADEGMWTLYNLPPADSYYAGEFVIYNAKNYLYAGKTTYDLVADTAENLVAAGTDVYLDMGFWGVVGALDAEGNAAPQYVNIADDTMYRDTAVEDETAAEAWVSAKYLFDNYFAAGQQYESMQAQYLYTASIADAATWDEVGFKKVDDYTVDFILANPVNEANFYVPYNLSSSYLVYKPVYEACKTFYKDGKEVATEEEADEVKTKYGRSVENTVSYGPYKLSSFELDKEYTLTRNDNWYGYHDGKHVGQYQTDIYKVTCIADHATQMLAFEKGEVDDIALQADDLKKYGNSKYIKYGPNNGYTTKLTMNTDYEKLLSHGTNSQVLVIPEFRQAISYCYDRKEFASSFTAAGTALAFKRRANASVLQRVVQVVEHGDVDSVALVHAQVNLDVAGAIVDAGSDSLVIRNRHQCASLFDFVAGQRFVRFVEGVVVAALAPGQVEQTAEDCLRGFAVTIQRAGEGVVAVQFVDQAKASRASRLNDCRLKIQTFRFQHRAA